MTYSKGRLEPESKVTQKVYVRPKRQTLKQARKEVEALEEANRSLQIQSVADQEFKRGQWNGFFAGLILGLVTGSVLAAAILGPLI